MDVNQQILLRNPYAVETVDRLCMPGIMTILNRSKRLYPDGFAEPESGSDPNLF